MTDAHTLLAHNGQWPRCGSVDKRHATQFGVGDISAHYETVPSLFYCIKHNDWACLLQAARWLGLRRPAERGMETEVCITDMRLYTNFSRNFDTDINKPHETDMAQRGKVRENNGSKYLRSAEEEHRLLVHTVFGP